MTVVDSLKTTLNWRHSVIKCSIINDGNDKRKGRMEGMIGKEWKVREGMMEEKEIFNN